MTEATIIPYSPKMLKITNALFTRSTNWGWEMCGLPRGRRYSFRNNIYGHVSRITEWNIIRGKIRSRCRKAGWKPQNAVNLNQRFGCTCAKRSESKSKWGKQDRGERAAKWFVWAEARWEIETGAEGCPRTDIQCVTQCCMSPQTLGIPPAMRLSNHRAENRGLTSGKPIVSAWFT